MNQKLLLTALVCIIVTNLSFAQQQQNKIDPTGEVGVGILNPKFPLHLRTNDVTTSFLIHSRNSTSGSFWPLKIKTNTAANVSGFKSVNDNIRLILKNALQEQNIQLNPSGISYFNGGNIGIGTTSPSSLLDVAGTLNATSVTIAGVPLSDVISNAASWTKSGANINFTSGNVGIGISNPVTPLHINGGTTSSIKITTTLTGNTVNDGVSFGYDDQIGTFIWDKENKPIVFGTNDIERMRLSSEGNLLLDAGNIGIGTQTPINPLHIHSQGVNSIARMTTDVAGGTINDGASIGYSNSLGMVVWNKENTALQLATNNLSRMTIKADGKVGIGISSPLKALHVYNPISERIIIAESGGTNAGIQLKGSAKTFELWTSETINNNGFGVYDANQQTYRLSIDGNNGFVGIGVNAPAYELDVSGTINATDIKVNGTSVDEMISSSSPWNKNGNDISYSLGKIGIGTTTPSKDLEIIRSVDAPTGISVLNSGSKGQSSVLVGEANLGRYVYMGYFNAQNDNEILKGRARLSTGAPNGFDLHSRNGFTFRTNWGDQESEVIRITENGKLGINNHSPQYELDVSGTINATDIKVNGASINDAITNASSWSKNGSNVNFTSGNVGIGTTTTGGHMLAVEGSIGARRVKVESKSWADFVFKPTYELTSLKDVEAHINQHGHLKDIPSEAQVTEEGIDVAEMDAKLLQKIEELTLYLIEQNKKIEKLENKLNTILTRK